MPRHLRRVHKKGDATGKIRVGELAGVLRVKSSSIITYLTYLAGVGDPHASHSNALDDALVAKVLQHFLRSGDTRGQMKEPTKPEQGPQDLEVLRAKVAGLETNLYKRNQVPTELSVSSAGVPVDDGVAAKVREHFQVTPDQLGKVNASSQTGAVLQGRPENLAQGLTKQLRDYDEWTWLSRRPARPADAPTKQQQAPLQVDFPVERLYFEFLPPGTYSMEYVVSHYGREAHRFPADIHGREIDWTRFEAIKLLRPAKCYVGKVQWLGYYAFEFQESSLVVLECLLKGNATYVLWGDWQRMAAHPKSYIWRHFSGSYRRIFHRDKTKWLTKIRRALKHGRRILRVGGLSDLKAHEAL